MRIKFLESTFVRGSAVDRGDVRDEEPTLAQALIASRRAVAVVDDIPATAPAVPEQAATTGTETVVPEQAATTGTETATTAPAASKPRRRG